MPDRETARPSASRAWHRRIHAWTTSVDAALGFGERWFARRGMRTCEPAQGLAGAKSILVVRLDKIGDVVLNSSFLRELRRSAPAAWITLVVAPETLDLVQACPHVNEALAYDFQVQSRFWRLIRHRRAIAFARSHLWKRRFDLALSPRFDADQQHAGFVAYFSGATSRIGWSESVTAARAEINAGEDRLFTRLLQRPVPVHEAERNLEFLRRIGGSVTDAAAELCLTDHDEMAARRALGSDAPYVVVAPGAGVPKRLWPAARFAEAARRLCATGERVVILGAPSERALGQEVAAALDGCGLDLTGQLRLRESAAVIRGARLFLCNDTGIAHVAAAVGTSVVVIACHPADGSDEHENAPARFRPQGGHVTVVQPPTAQSPCEDGCGAEEPHCVLGVTVDAVVQAAATAC